MSNKEIFMSIYEKSINRNGARKLMEWIEKTDFFTAPASTRFHGAKEGGLCEHSIHVFERLQKLALSESNSQLVLENMEESIAICGLLHDVCKINFYKTSFRNVKNEQTGQWEKQPCYTIEDDLPYGHGEKSVYIISKFMRLTLEEAMAIRWHMGGFDDAVKGGSYALNGAFEKYPIAVLTHIADMQATYLDESKI